MWIICDEATSALDNESEKYIQKPLEELLKNITTIVIAYRISTIKNTDEILVLTEDSIRESGTHEQLMHKKGVYSSLYSLQFEQVS